jgi:predicted phosphodiesterase
MAIVVLADVHANLVALDAVLADAGQRGEISELWVLGDLIGYGPRPNECIERIREFEHKAVAGNHEHAAVGKITTEEFNPYAAAAAEWTAETLTKESREYIEALPELIQLDEFTMVHGTIRDPIWEYLITHEAVVEQLARQTTTYSLIGHTHIPTIVQEEESGAPMMRLPDGAVVPLNQQRLILNPGSAGQPRDGDSRACYAFVDMEERTFSHVRVEYDIRETQRQMKGEGLPQYLIERLAKGR